MAFLDRLMAQDPNQNMNFNSTLLPINRTLGNAQELPIEGVLSRIEPFLNRQRQANLEDMQSQQDIMSRMPSLQGGRIRQVADPNSVSQQNVVFNPGMTDYQRASLGQDQQKINLEAGKAKTAERVGDEKLSLQGDKLALDTEKNKNIYETKQKELEQKATDAESKLKLAYDQLQGRENNAVMQDQYHRAQIAATDARHALDIAAKNKEIEDNRVMNEARIKQLHDAADTAGYSITETNTSDPDETGNPTKKIVITKKGASAKASDKKVHIIGPDGKGGTVSEEESKNLPKGWKIG